MTEIKNPEAYKSLPRILLMDTQLKPHFVGYYDPDYNMSYNTNYLGGYFRNWNGDMEYDDMHLKGKKAAVFNLEHSIFGYKFNRKYGKRHLHTMYIVGINDINLMDVTETAANGDMLIYAEQVNRKSRDGGEFVLLEVRPHMTRQELVDLKNKTTSVIGWKEESMENAKARAIAEANEFNAEKRADSAEAVNDMNRETISSLLAQVHTMLDMMRKGKIKDIKILAEAIDDLEVNVDAGIEWNLMLKKKYDETLENGEKQFNFVNSLEELNPEAISENTKEHMLRQLMNTCGADFVVRKVNEYAVDGELTTEINSLHGFSMKLHDLRNSGRITDDQMKMMYRDGQDRVQNYQSRGLTVSDAVKRMSKEVLPPENSISGWRPPSQNSMKNAMQGLMNHVG